MMSTSQLKILNEQLDKLEFFLKKNSMEYENSKEEKLSPKRI